MKSIEFTNKEIKEMRIFYNSELEKTLVRLENIREILKKLGTDEKEISKNQVLSNLPEAKITEKKIQSENIKKSKKPNKSKWGSFILDFLRKQVKPVKFNDIVDNAVEKYTIPKDKYKNVVQSITNSLFRLRNKHKKINSIKLPGQKEKYYGLRTWFDKNGELKEKYRENFTPTLTEKQKILEKVTISETKTEKSPETQIWTEFVMNTLKNENRPIHVKSLTEKAMQTFNIDEKLYKKTRISVSRSMSKLERENTQLKTYLKAGVKYFGLLEWFDKNGELIEKYKERISLIPPVKPKKKKDKPEKPSNTFKYPQFVLNKLKEHNSVMQAKTFTELALKEFDINKSDSEKARTNIANALFKHEYSRNIIKSFNREGFKYKFYGLTEWFDNKGIIKEPYLNKL